jgi:hypothetical protein
MLDVFVLDVASAMWVSCTLWEFKIAMELVPVTDVLPIKNDDFQKKTMLVLNCQRVKHT